MKQHAAIRKGLESFLKAYTDAKLGRAKAPDALAKARTDLVAALASGSLSSRLPALQRFLRSPLVEILGALSTPGASVKPMFEKHGEELDEAWKEADEVMGNPRFWESTV